MTRSILITLGAIVAIALTTSLVRCGRKPSGPNVILISIDSLRADHLSCYGYPRKTSPNLDALAQSGVLFETSVSTTSWTLPSHAAMLTGLPDVVHGATDIDKWLDGSRVTLAEKFKDAGYATGGFFSGPFLHPGYGFAQGFDQYIDCSTYGDDVVKSKDIGAALDLMHEKAPKEQNNERVLENVGAWIDKSDGKPFFLFVHLWDVHYDWTPPAAYDKFTDPRYDGPLDGTGITAIDWKTVGRADRDIQHLRDLYDGEILWTDHVIGRLLAKLKAAGLDDNTIIAVTADHGDEFFEHDGFTHRNTLHEEVVRTPLIIRGPAGGQLPGERSLPPGTRVKEQAAVYDVAPTLLALAGLPPFPVAEGRSLLPAVHGRRVRPTEATPESLLVGDLQAANAKHFFFSLRHDTWKIIVDWEIGKHFVYDLVNDPGEQRPLAESDYPLPPAELDALCRDARQRLSKLASRLPPIGDRDTPSLPAMQEKHLRSLGYLR